MRNIGVAGVLLAVGVLSVVPAAAQTVPVGNVVMHLPFEETTGTVFADTGNGANHGIFCDRGVDAHECPAIDASSTTAAGQLGTGLSMVNTIGGMTYNSLVDIPVPGASLPTSFDSFAVSFWMQQPIWADDGLAGIPPAYGLIATQYDEGALWGWTAGVDPHPNNTNTVCFKSSGGTVTNWSVDVNGFADNSYHHFLVQFEPDPIGLGATNITAVYVDGVAQADTGNVGWNLPTTSGFVLGAREPNVQFPIRSGVLDDFAIVNGVVAAGNVGNIMSGNYSGMTLKARYTLDETTGSTITDSSGNGNHGNLVGFAIEHPYDVSNATAVGQVGNGVEFAPTSTTYGEFVRVSPTATQIGAGEAFTAMFWLKTLDWDANSVIAVQTTTDQEGNATFGYSIGLHGTSDGLIVRTTDFDGPGTDKLGGVNLLGTGAGGIALTEGEFAHFAIVFDADGTVGKIYVNGDLATQDIATPAGWDIYRDFAGTILGTRRNPANPYNYQTSYALTGVLDDYAVIRGQLTEAQIEAAMAAGVASIIDYTAVVIPGDATGEGVVNAADAQRLAQFWGATVKDDNYSWWQMGDFNDDHVVNAADASILAANWTSGSGEGNAVPEPGTLGLVLGSLVAGAAVWRRRK